MACVKGKNSRGEECGPGEGKISGKDKRKAKAIYRAGEKEKRQSAKLKRKKGKKKFIAGSQYETKSEHTIPGIPGVDSQAHVIKPGQKTIVTDVSKTIDGGTTTTTTKGFKESDTSGATIQATGDEATDYQQAKNIGMTDSGAKLFVEGYESGTEEKTKQGLSKNYFSRGLYKATNRGMEEQKGYDYSTQTTPGEEISPGVKAQDKTIATGLHTKKGSGARQKIYKGTGSKEEKRQARREGTEAPGMSRKDITMHRKAARETARETGGTATKYISAERIQKKKERMDKSMERGTDKDFKRGKNYKQNQRRKKRGIGPTEDLGPNSMDILAQK